MTIGQKRETVVSLLRKIDRDHHRKGTSTRIGLNSVPERGAFFVDYSHGEGGSEHPVDRAFPVPRVQAVDRVTVRRNPLSLAESIYLHRNGVKNTPRRANPL